MTTAQQKTVQLLDFSPPRVDFFSEVITGLKKDQKTLSPKFLYDELGSQLFEKITILPEYYPTRTEKNILMDYTHEIGEEIGNDATLIELGSGSSEKIKTLLDHISTIKQYIPIDISKEILSQSITSLHQQYENVNIVGICADFTQMKQLPDIESSGKKIIFYPGSTLGNFEKKEAFQYLNNLKTLLDKGDGVLIGIDLKKEPELLHEAYNDSLGITDEFNLNLLTRMNRELKANFKKENFSHHAFYNEEMGRIEMHIKSLENQKVLINQEEIIFKKGETIHTENSYKYSIQEFQTLAANSGFLPKKVWTDDKNWFSIHYLENVQEDVKC